MKFSTLLVAAGLSLFSISTLAAVPPDAKACVLHVSGNDWGVSCDGNVVDGGTGADIGGYQLVSREVGKLVALKFNLKQCFPPGDYLSVVCIFTK